VASNPYESALDEMEATTIGPTAAAPPPNPYEGALAGEPDPEQKRNDENATLTQVFHSAQLDKPDVEKKAQVLALTAATGLHSGLVEGYFDKIKASYEAAQTTPSPVAGGRVALRFDPEAWRRINPELAKIVLERPDLGTLVTRDPQMSYVTTALRKVSDLFFTPVVNGKLEPTTPDEKAQFDELSRFREDVKPKVGPAQQLLDDPKAQVLRNGGWQGKLVVPIARYLETKQRLEISKAQFRLMLERARGADTYELEKELLDRKHEAVARDYGEGAVGQVFSDAATAAASTIDVAKEGGAAAGVAGTVAAGLTFAATRNPTLAVESGIKAGSVFGKVGAVIGTFQLESGDAYGDLQNAKTDGGKLLDNDVATGAALIYGTLAAGIEFATWGPILKSMGPLGELIKKGERKAALEAMVKNPTFRVMAKRVAKHWLEASAAEGGEETLQTGTQDAVQYFARSFQQGSFSSKQDVDVGKMILSGEKGFIGGAALGAVNVTTDVLTHQLLRDKSQAGQEQAAAVHAAAGSPTVTAAPDAAAAAIEDASAKTGQPVTHLHIDTEAFTKEAEKLGVDPSALAARAFGERGAQLFQDARDAGEKIAVPAADYVHFAETEADLSKALLPHTTTGAELLTGDLLESLKKRLEDETKAAQEGQATAQAVTQDFEKQAVPDQVRELYGDANTGLLNERGYDAVPADPSLPVDATFEFEGQKFINDLEHDYSVFDAVLRKAAPVLRKATPVAGRVGGAVRGRFATLAEAKAAARKMEKALGGKIRVSLASEKNAARAQGSFAHRGSPPIAFLQQGEHQAFGRAQAALEADQQAAPEDVAVTKAATARAAKETADLVREVKATPAASAPITTAVHATAHGKLGPGEASSTANFTPEGLYTAGGWARLRRIAKKAHVAFADARGFGDMRKALVKVLGSEKAGNAAMDQLASVFFSTVRQFLDPRDDAARLNPRGDELLSQTDDKARLEADLNDLADALKDRVFYAVGPDGRVFVQEGLQFLHGFGADEKAAGAVVEQRKPGQVVRKPRILTEAEWQELRKGLPREPLRLGGDQGVGPGPASGSSGPTGGAAGSAGSQEVDAAVGQGQQAAGLLPIFKSAAEAGMDAKQWQAYLEAQDKATKHAAETARLRIAKDRARRTEGWWKDQLAKERAAADTEYEQLPAFVALQWLRGKAAESADAVSLDRAEVEQLVGKEAAARFPQNLLRNEGGALPDQVAGLFGYATGEDMVRDILALPERKQWTRELADARMAEKHPDVLNEAQQLRDVVNAGLHGPFSLKWLLAELKALAARPFELAFNPEANRTQAVANELLGKPETVDQDTRKRAGGDRREPADRPTEPGPGAACRARVLRRSSPRGRGRELRAGARAEAAAAAQLPPLQRADRSGRAA
jgi:hypothetical protein